MEIAVGKAKAAATYHRPAGVFMDAINKGGLDRLAFVRPVTQPVRREI
jgi:hypothetical protein